MAGPSFVVVLFALRFSLVDSLFRVYFCTKNFLRIFFWNKKNLGNLHENIQKINLNTKKNDKEKYTQNIIWIEFIWNRMFTILKFTWLQKRTIFLAVNIQRKLFIKNPPACLGMCMMCRMCFCVCAKCDDFELCQINYSATWKIERVEETKKIKKTTVVVTTTSRPPAAAARTKSVKNG